MSASPTLRVKTTQTRNAVGAADTALASRKRMVCALKARGVELRGINFTREAGRNRYLSCRMQRRMLEDRALSSEADTKVAITAV